jgi:hypothetical protein
MRIQEWGATTLTAAWWRRRARLVLVLLVILLVAVGTMIESSLPNSTSSDSASSVPVGLFVSSQSPADVLALGKQLGVTPTVMTVYADGSCYCTYADPPSTSMTLMLGVGALTPSEATSIGQSLVAAGQSHAIIRIMWEQNQNVDGWFPDWNQTAMSAAQYISTFQSVVTTMRAVPGEAFKFMWNPNGGTGNEASGRTWEDTWPGSSYVNYVGVDQYDYSGYAANIQAAITFAQSPPQSLNGGSMDQMTRRTSTVLRVWSGTPLTTSPSRRTSATTVDRGVSTRISPSSQSPKPLSPLILAACPRRFRPRQPRR